MKKWDNTCKVSKSNVVLTFLLLLLLLVGCSKQNESKYYNKPIKSYSSRIIEQYNISKESFNDSLSTNTWNASSRYTFYKQIDSLITRAYITLDSVEITKRIDK